MAVTVKDTTARVMSGMAALLASRLDRDWNSDSNVLDDLLEALLPHLTVEQRNAHYAEARDRYQLANALECNTGRTSVDEVLYEHAGLPVTADEDANRTAAMEWAQEQLDDALEAAGKAEADAELAADLASMTPQVALDQASLVVRTVVGNLLAAGDFAAVEEAVMRVDVLRLTVLEQMASVKRRALLVELDARGAESRVA